MGPFRKFSKTGIPEKSGRVTCLVIDKTLKHTQVIKRDHSIVLETKQFVTQTTKTQLEFNLGDV